MRSFGVIGAVAAAALLAIGVPSASASTIDFTYTGGGGPACGGCTTTGTGSFSFLDSPTSVALADLTSFSLVNDFGGGNTFFTYGLGDLSSFSATLDAAQTVTALSFQTLFVGGVGPNSAPEALQVTSLGVNGGKTFSCVIFGPVCVNGQANLTVGTVTASTVPDPTAVPEPASLLLLGSGLVAVVRRRFKNRS
jgi:hypothetical protein